MIALLWQMSRRSWVLYILVFLFTLLMALLQVKKEKKIVCPATCANEQLLRVDVGKKR